MLTANDKYYRWGAIAVLSLIAVLIVATFQQYGITWDEELQSQYGLAVVDYYQSFFKDLRFQEIFNLYLYGGMFDGVASVIDRFTPFSVYETRHFVNASFGLLGLWGTWRLGRLLGGGAAGLMALVMLALTPMYYGHMFNNPKDIPFAAGIIWSLYYMGRCFERKADVPWRLIVKLGFIYGLTLGIRVGGIMLLAFWFGVLGLDVLREFWNSRRIPWPMVKRYAFRVALPVALIAYVVMLICWPWAQQNPIKNPLRALGEFSNFPQDVEVLLDGVNYRSTQLPWFYVPLYFGVQLPEFIIVLLAAACLAMPKIWTTLTVPKRQVLIVILMMGLFPIVYAMLRHPALYDTVRHFLFVVPIACVIAATAAHEIYIWAIRQFDQQRSRNLIACAIGATAMLVIATQIDIMERLHPYEYIYVNRFAGGVAGAYGHYELDYWGSSFKEAANRLQNFVAKEGGVPSGKIYKVAICGPWSAAMIYLPPDYEAVVANEPAEFFLSTTRWSCQNMRPGKTIVEVRRLGAPLAVIKDLRGGYEYYDGNKNEKK